MMKELSPLHLILGSLVAAVAAGSEIPDLPACPTWEDGIAVPIEHSDGACDSSFQNSPERYEANQAATERSVWSGALLKMKDERSWICPEDEVAGEMSGQGMGFDADGSAQGPKTKWIVRNRSSNPISIALVDASRNNVEVSALNPKTSPAHADPEAVLPPGQWKSVEVTLGTLLHVRELLRVGDTVAPGRILLRHRPGLVPIRDRSFEPVDAPDYGDVDDEEETAEEIDAKEAQRPSFSYDRLCNSLNRIFVNRVGSPVDVYWAGASDLDSSSGAAEHGKDCQSRFAFHLGTSVRPSKGFVHKRETIMSEESSYLGHRFVARLTSDPSRIVDEVVLDRSDVRDCPMERKVEASTHARQNIGVQVGGKVDEGEDDETKRRMVTVYESVAANLTSSFIGISASAY